MIYSSVSSLQEKLKTAKADTISLKCISCKHWTETKLPGTKLLFYLTNVLIYLSDMFTLCMQYMCVEYSYANAHECAGVDICVMHAGWKEGSLLTLNLEGSRPDIWVWKSSMGPLEEQQVLLYWWAITPDSYSVLFCYVFFFFCGCENKTQVLLLKKKSLLTSNRSPLSLTIQQSKGRLKWKKLVFFTACDLPHLVIWI